MPPDVTLPPESPTGHRLSCPTASLPVAGRFPRSWAVRAQRMGKKHRRPNLWERLIRRQPGPARPVRITIAQVDAHTGVRHLLTPDAVAAGRVKAGRYIALCGAQVIPAPTGSGVKCQPCQIAAAIPTQRNRR